MDGENLQEAIAKAKKEEEKAWLDCRKVMGTGDYAKARDKALDLTYALIALQERLEKGIVTLN